MGERPVLLQLMFGFAVTQLLRTAAQFSVADHLASGPRTAAELAAATGTHAPSLHRLLRGLACLGAVVEVAPGRFELTPVGQPLRADAPDSVRQLLMLAASAEAWRSWGELEYTVRTGIPAWDKVVGQSTYEFYATHPVRRATLDAAMADQTRTAAPALVGGYDFTRFGTVVDVGGGDGTLIAAILRVVPGLRGVLYDLPDALAPAGEVLAGVADRCEVVSGDFFASVPAGADAYLLKSVLHNWNDERAGAVLRNCRTAMSPAGVVLAVETVLPDRVDLAGGDPDDPGRIMSDLNMMVNTGGKERTATEFAALYRAAGLELTELAGPLAGYHIIVGTPVIPPGSADPGDR